MSAYVPQWLFTGVHADITEWDGTIHTVKCTLQKPRSEIGGCFQDLIVIEYCDGVRHVVPMKLFLESMAGRIHHFGWTHYHSGGGSSYHRLGFHHVAGCGCKLKTH